MSEYLLFNKPFQVMCQFTDEQQRKTLAHFIDVPNVYSAGRLDYDSEGLLILTDDGKLIQTFAHPKFKVPKTYLVQVEGIPTDDALEQLSRGVELKDGLTKPASVKLADQPDWLWPRQPPIRERKTIPTAWVQIQLQEGRNRQVRRMTAAVGYPTLRLIRTHIANISVEGLGLGLYRRVSLETLKDNGIKRANSPPRSLAESQKNRRQNFRRRRPTSGIKRSG